MPEPVEEPGFLSPERMPVTIGAITLVAGVSLLVAPRPMTRLLGIEGQETATRLLGLADLVLVPGLLGGRPRWPWMIGRAALNVGQAAYLQGVTAESSKPERTRAGAAILGVLTLFDGCTALLLRRRGS